MSEWRENQIPTPVDKPEYWTMYFDGSLKLDAAVLEFYLFLQEANN
jgi:hypothetical protein